MLKAVLTAFYFLTLTGIALFGIHRCCILYLYFRNRHKVSLPQGRFDVLPRVTIQLPIYNEMYVVSRLIEAVTRIDYPKHLLQIQVLDDSTDETVRIASSLCEAKRRDGFDISHMHRSNRDGYKAGALREGLKRAIGDFIAIFDADFIPSPDVVRKTVDYFTDPTVGMVQVRWGHLNRAHSALTRIQSIFLDGHFIIHHTARYRSGLFFNFNGTAGIWRKHCIEEAGGWQDDTLTEDMDLSYRAQLKGWKFVYLPDVVSPAELPVEMDAFKTQQHRWAKGAIQTGIKVLPALWKSRFSLLVKLESTFCLLNNVGFVLAIVFFLLLLPAMLMDLRLGPYQSVWFDLPLFIVTTSSFWFFYFFAQREGNCYWKPTFYSLIFLTCVGVGLSLNNASAVMEALSAPKGGVFLRTPKLNIRGTGTVWKTKRYQGFQNRLLPILEFVFGIYFFLLAILAIHKGYYCSVPFLVMFQIGFFYVSGLSLFQRRSRPIALSLSQA
ncbi:MAG: glycosyltransferase family 2 protein [Candidatus Omnitrophica bacterium]|nr:glycosyltransferase family 2 protein [Candidatus Omnitrophota bacterium]